MITIAADRADWVFFGDAQAITGVHFHRISTNAKKKKKRRKEKADHGGTCRAQCGQCARALLALVRGGGAQPEPQVRTYFGLVRAMSGSEREMEMSKDPKVIEHLNTQLTNELTAINQYFLHARILQHWASPSWAKQEHGRSIDEMNTPMS